MKVKQNIGIVNALIRITIGLTVLSWGSAKFVKKPWCESYLWWMLLGAMKVAEGIVRYCPVTHLFQQGQHMMQEREQQPNDQRGENLLPYNPS